MTHSVERIIVHKNRKRAFWSMVIVAFFVPISAALLFMGLQPGRSDVGWSLVLFGAVGVVAFTACAVVIMRVMRAPWHLELNPSHLILYTPAYDLKVPWDSIVAIAVDEVTRRSGCLLVFGDIAAVARGATFHAQPKRPDAVTDVQTMQARMAENFDHRGYHLAIPSRILEKGPEELAELLTEARRGNLWPRETQR